MISLLYEQMGKLEDSEHQLKTMTDVVLDLYKTNPEKAKDILLELGSIQKEFDELRAEMEEIHNEIH